MSEANVWYLGMQYDHRFFLSKRPPVIADIEGTNTKALYFATWLDAQTGELKGDRGKDGICPAVAAELWPDAYATLRPLDFVQVTFEGGHMIDQVFKFKAA